MKKVLVFISLFIILPVYSLDMDYKGAMKFGKEVSVSKIDDSALSVSYDEYFGDLNKKLQKAWCPPNHNKDLRVVLTICLNKNGSLKSMKVTRTSGFNDVDISALALIKSNTPFSPFPANAEEHDLTLKVSFDRYILGQPTIKSNDTKIVLSENSYKYSFANITSKEEKEICKQYIKSVTKSLTESVVLPDYSQILMSRFQFNITKDGHIENIKISAKSSNKNFNQQVMSKLKEVKLPVFPAGLNQDSITVEYNIGNNPSQRPKYNPIRDAGSVLFGVPMF